MHSQILKDWTLTYDQVSTGRFESFLQEISFDGIQLYQEKFKPSIFQRGEARRKSLCLGLFSELNEEGIWMGKHLSGQEILSCYDQDEILLKTPQNSAFYSLTIPYELLDPHYFENESTKYCNLLSGDQSKSFHQNFINLFNNLMLNTDFMNHQMTREQVKSEILDLSESLLNTLNQQYQPTKIVIHKAQQVVRKVCDVLHENRDQCFSIDELSKLTFTSRRTLQNCFELITGQSPAQFLKFVKLNAVRRALQKPNSYTSVSDTAADWGFWHLSQFSADYKKLFGETPSQTLAIRKC